MIEKSTIFEDKIKSSLEKHRKILTEILKVSDKFGVRTYLVGGFIRDVVLEIETADIDLVVEGDTYELSQELRRILRGKNYKYIENFGTASFDIEFYGKVYRIDFARARREEYPIPGEHPKVSFVDDVRVDLLRRDFSINAIAIEFDQNLNFKFIDVVGGLDDLMAKKIKILHKMSIADDPTRILRGVRISLKTGFEIDQGVIESLEIAKKIGAFKNVHGSRFFSEMKITAKEDFFDKFIEKLKELNVLISIHPALDINVYNFSGDWQDKIAELILRVSPESRYEIASFFGVPKSISKRLEKLSRV
ncbi:MAG: hypothetical protein NZ927_06120 [Candidatus Calescibacterium sp.]|nr:hypothetical protein [Candidatus Calescibacterium sp.]MCX7734326.1 hypothetical protein [bacterium]MDW8087597.1 hypothetical protein [Candidatus Calescibacterium sp.]